MGAKTGLNRLVLDTNVVVSALLFTGPANKLVDLWQQGNIHPLVSSKIVLEYTRVFAYPKFRLSREEITGLLQEELLPFVTPVSVSHVPAVIKEDPNDDVFLACAVEGKADAVVSGDRHLLRLKSHHGIPVMTVKECVEQCGSSIGKG